MSSPILIDSVLVTLEVVIADELVERNVGYLPWLLGENLAGQIDAYVNEHGMNYYPALDFFRDKPQAVDPALLQLIDQVALWCGDYARREIRRRLSRAFSSVSLVKDQIQAYTMPRIRPQPMGAPHELSRHYSPNRFRLELKLNSIQKGGFEGNEALAVRKLKRWLGGDVFERYAILSTAALN